jgi:hypothetical protein
MHWLSYSFLFFAVTEINQQILQCHTLVFCNHLLPMLAIIFQTTKFLFSTTQTKSGFFFFANAHNSWLQSLTQISCNHTLAQLFFSFFCSHRNKPAVFAMTHFSFLQSLTTQACNHIPNNQVSFFNHTDKVRFLFFANAHNS